MPKFSDDGRWVWDYASSQWIPANKIDDGAELEALGYPKPIIEPDKVIFSDLGIGTDSDNLTKLKVFAIIFSIFLPGIDYCILGKFWLGIAILHVWVILLASAIGAPLAFVIWIHGMVTVAGRADERAKELGGYTNNIFGSRIANE